MSNSIATGEQNTANLELIANKDASNGYAGLTLLKINFKDVLGTFTSFFTNSNTASRTYTFQDKTGTVSMLSDVVDASGKTTPVDADLIGIMDSAASNVLKSLSWANLKATLKTYFDTIYPVNGAWTSWTPTFTNLTVGNGTLSARYKQIGDKTYAIAVQLTLGSTSSVSTSPSFTIPFTLASSAVRCIGSGSAYDLSGVTPYSLQMQVKSSTEFYIGLNYVIGTNIGVRGLTSAIPITFTTGDILYVEGIFEIA